VWDIESAEELASLTVNRGTVNAVHFSPDGTLLAAYHQWDGYLQLWETEGFQPLAGAEIPYTASGVSFEFLPDGRRIVAASEDGRIWICQVDPLRILGSLKGHRESVMDLALSPDGKHIVTGEYAGRLMRWSLDADLEGEVLARFDAPVYSLAFSPADLVIASGHADGKIRLWDVRSRRQKQCIETPPNHIRALTFFPGGETVAAAGTDGKVTLWRVADGALLDTFAVHSKTAHNAIAVSPCKRFLATAGQRHVTLRDLHTGKLLFNSGNEGGDANGVAFSASGDRFLFGGALNKLVVWNIARQERTELPGHLRQLISVKRAPAGNIFATGSLDDTVRLWDIDVGRELATLTGHKGNIEALAFSPDGKTLATGSEDRTIMLWDAATGEFKMTLGTHDGQLLASCANDGAIKLWGAVPTSEAAP
jgi:WD40 repeat protein